MCFSLYIEVLLVTYAKQQDRTRLRTQPCFFYSSLSEVSSSSDTILHFTLLLVRSQLGFGHLHNTFALPRRNKTASIYDTALSDESK
jgi:hypothetical protein